MKILVDYMGDTSIAVSVTQSGNGPYRYQLSCEQESGYTHEKSYQFHDVAPGDLEITVTDGDGLKETLVVSSYDRQIGGHLWLVWNEIFTLSRPVLTDQGLFDAKSIPTSARVIDSKFDRELIDFINEIGLNAISITLPWYYVQRQSGERYFDGFRFVLDYAHQKGIKMFVRLWLLRQDLDFIYGDEDVMLSHDGKLSASEYDRMLSFHSPRWEDAMDFVNACASFLKPYQDAGDLLAVSISTQNTLEFGYAFEADHQEMEGMSDGHPAAQTAFQNWLLQKYHHLDHINTALKSAYTNLEDIRIPGDFSSLLGHEHFNFRTHVLTGICNRVGDIFESVSVKMPWMLLYEQGSFHDVLGIKRHSLNFADQATHPLYKWYKDNPALFYAADYDISNLLSAARSQNRFCCIEWTNAVHEAPIEEERLAKLAFFYGKSIQSGINMISFAFYSHEDEAGKRMIINVLKELENQGYLEKTNGRYCMPLAEARVDYNEIFPMMVSRLVQEKGTTNPKGTILSEFTQLAQGQEKLPFIKVIDDFA